MHSPKVGKPRAAREVISLSRKLPKLTLPQRPASEPRPRPQVARPAKRR